MKGMRVLKVIILSDTHMPRMAKKFPQPLLEEMKSADLLIHVGDWQTKAVYEELKQYAPVTGVHGNVDESFFYNEFEKKMILELEGHRIGITHGHGRGKTTEKRAIEQFDGEEVDLILFGHSHIPLHKEYDGRIIFNPGSPTDKRRQSHYSFGKMVLHKGKRIQIEHLFFTRKR